MTEMPNENGKEFGGLRTFENVELAVKNQVSASIIYGINSQDVEPAYVLVDQESGTGKGVRIGYKGALEKVTAELVFSNESHLTAQPFDWTTNEDGDVDIDWHDVSVPLSDLTQTMHRLSDPIQDQQLTKLSDDYEEHVRGYQISWATRHSNLDYARDDERVMQYSHELFKGVRGIKHNEDIALQMLRDL
ncbi:hypothetical protein [Weissella viridescens]|uniref:hypothetical protein n=1 Tax=Weissella viridescens TaxID=1629 RepID=UPI003AF2CD4C